MRAGDRANAQRSDDPTTSPQRPRPAPRAARTEWIELAHGEDGLGFKEAVRAGLTADREGRAATKTLPTPLLYDEVGSRLFEAICELPEYYLTRAEREILARVSHELAAQLPAIDTLVELGSGSATKTELLLRAFEADGRDLTYAPIDVSRSALEQSVARLEQRHPALRIRPAVAEYEAGLSAIHELGFEPILTLWLGSSIGNLRPGRAAEFMRRLRARMGADDRLLVGIDLRKDRATLEAAYDDAAGVTARFDLNLLTRLNRELDGDFDLEQFRHVAHYDEPSGSVQSFLESRCDQRVQLRGLDLELEFRAGERIHTEDSHKYSPQEIDALAEAADLRVERRDLDGDGRFSLNLFAPR